MHSWSVVIMCFNEEGTLERVVNEAVRIVSTIVEDYEIVIVDDGSSDGSTEIASRLASSHVRVVRHPSNLGVGEVMRTGYGEARKEWLTFLPADAEFNVEDLRVGAPLVREKVAVVYNIELMPPWYRRIVSGLQRLLNAVLFRLRVCRVNWVKILPTRAVAAMPLVSRSPVVETEVLVRLMREGWTFVEPVSRNALHLDRRGGMSRSAFLRAVIRSLAETIRLAFALASEHKS